MMRDLSTHELGFVYGAGGKSKACKPPKKSKCKGGSSGSRKHGSRGKGSGSGRGRGRCGRGGSS